MSIAKHFVKTGILLFISILCLVNASLSQDVIPTKGTEFWVGFMDNYTGAQSLDLFVTSDQSTTGTVSIPQQSWTVDFTVQANQTTTITVPSALAEHQGENQLISNKGILVETADTVSVFAINFTQYTADGTKILPTKALGTEYRVTSYSGLSGLGSELLVVATEDETEIEITPSITTSGGNPAGVPFTVSLNRGQSYQIAQNAASDDLTGTIIKATENSGSCKPFAVFSGVSCTNIPVGCPSCDHIFEQNFPTITWGTDYFIVPYEFSNGYTYKILADKDGTDITINGSSNITLNAGQFYEANHVNIPTCVHSNLPISIVQFMQGEQCSGTGDPAMLFLNDAAQKIDNVTFSTVVSNVITNHGINVIMDTEDISSLTLDGAAVSSSEFTPFLSCPESSYAQLSIPQGSHTLDSPEFFTAYAFGIGSAETYSYSVGSFSPSPNGIVFEESYCTDEQVVLNLEEEFSEVVWYNYDFPDDILGTEAILVLEPPVNSGVYVADYNNFLSGCSQTVFYNVEVPIAPNITPEQVEFTICQHESVQLELEVNPYNSFYEYEWSPSLGLSSDDEQNPIASPQVTTDYEITISSPSGCSTASSNITINVVGGNYSNLNLEALETEFCVGKSTELAASIWEVTLNDDFNEGLNLLIWNELSNAEISDDGGSVSGSAMYFNGDGPRQLASFSLDLSNGGTVNFALNYLDEIDSGKEVVLEYSTDGNNWNELESYEIVDSESWTQHSIELPAQALSESTQLRWRQLSNSGNNQDNWALENVQVSTLSSSELDFQWYQNGQLIDTQNDTITVFPDSETVYIVELIDEEAGCSYLDSVTVNATYAFELVVSEDVFACFNEEVIIQAVPQVLGTYEYEWLPDDGSLSVVNTGATTVISDDSREYEVTVTSAEGCVNISTVNVTVSPELVLDLSASESPICLGDSILLQADLLGNPAGVNIEWFYNEQAQVQNAPVIEEAPSETFEIRVVVSDTLTGCFVESEIVVEVNGMFSVNAGDDISLCNAENYNLQASVSQPGNYIWNWQSASELNVTDEPSVFIMNNEGGEFIVIASEGECHQSDTVIVNSIYEGFDLGDNLEICENETIELNTGFQDANHLWSTGETSEMITVSEEQMYSVTLTSSLGCSLSDSIYLTVFDKPVIDLGEDLELCVGDIISLDAGNVGSDYLWNTGENSQILNISESGNYQVKITNVFGCLDSSEIELVFFQVPVSMLPLDSVICEDESVLLDAENEGSSYIWLPSLETSRIIEVNSAGVYTVEISNQGVCSVVDTFELSVKPYPQLNLGEDKIACDGDVIILNTSATPDLNVLWSSGETTSSLTVTESGTYGVQLDNEQCFISDEIGVFYKPLPDVNLLGEIEVCFLDLREPIYLDASYENSTYFWSNGSTEPILPISEEGVYTVDVTSEFGCDSSFTAVADEFCYGSYLYVPNSFSPNNDGINDGWRAEGEYVLDFHVQVYNRWGVVVFESNDIFEHWIGNDNRGDYFSPDGIYTFNIAYRYLNHLGKTSGWRERTGHVSLLK